MTIRAMNWAWGVELQPAMKLVLLKLADRANDDGECWPGMEAVAEACGVSVRSVMRYVQDMEKMGLLIVHRRKGEKGQQQTNIYTLNMSWQPGDKLSPGEAEPGDNGSTNRVTTVSPQIRLKPYLETTEETTVVTSKLATSSPDPIVEDPIQFDGVKWSIDNAVFDSWLVAYQNGRTLQDTEDWIESELAKAALWRIANPRKAKKNWLRFLTGWLTRASESTPYRRQYQQPQPRPYH